MKSKNAPMQNLQVHYTQDLSMFKIMKGNRVPNPQQIKRLEASIQTNGMLLNPIIVNERYKVIDGQHRLMAAKNRDSGVYYIIAPGYTLTQVQILNQNQKNWTKKDFCDAYAEMGVKDYVLLKEFHSRHPEFTLSVCAHICGDRSRALTAKVDKKGSISSQVSFNSGKWKAKHIKSADGWADKIKSLKPFYAGYNRRAFVASMLHMLNHKDFKHKQFLSKLKLQPTALVDCTNQSQYNDLIEKIYNYRRSKKINLRY